MSTGVLVNVIIIGVTHREVTLTFSRVPCVREHFKHEGSIYKVGSVTHFDLANATDSWVARIIAVKEQPSG